MNGWFEDEDETKKKCVARRVYPKESEAISVASRDRAWCRWRCVRFDVLVVVGGGCGLSVVELCVTPFSL